MAGTVLCRVTRGYAVPLLALALTATPLAAEDVVQIEEHWSLSVGGPDVGRAAPQVSMVMSPAGGVDGEFFLLMLNHWSQPEFAPGGVQLQYWNGDVCQEAKHAGPHGALDVDGETVRWAQRLTLADGELTFEVFDAVSQSWGNFAADNALRIVTPTELSRLNGYLPATSLTESGIGYAGNRVSSLVLEKLRWRFAGEEEFHEMVAPIDIDADIDP